LRDGRKTRIYCLLRFDRRENLNAFHQKLVRELTTLARGFPDDLGAPELLAKGKDVQCGNY
jgi:hypothetical protein